VHAFLCVYIPLTNILFFGYAVWQALAFVSLPLLLHSVSRDYTVTELRFYLTPQTASQSANSISLTNNLETMDVRRGSSSSGAMRSNSVVAADADLARMGYKSELPRNLSMLSVLGLSFAIMAVPYGLSTTMYITLTDGQSVTVIWGWVLISLISTSIAASLAEICAVYPTAGGKVIQILCEVT